MACHTPGWSRSESAVYCWTIELNRPTHNILADGNISSALMAGFSGSGRICLYESTNRVGTKGPGSMTATAHDLAAEVSRTNYRRFASMCTQLLLGVSRTCSSRAFESSVQSFVGKCNFGTLIWAANRRCFPVPIVVVKRQQKKKTT